MLMLNNYLIHFDIFAPQKKSIESELFPDEGKID